MFQQRLAEEMKRRRKEMGITQEQLAEMIEKSTAFVGQLERGVTRPKIDTLELIITKLSLDARYLFGADLSIEEDYQKNTWIDASNERKQSKNPSENRCCSA